MGLGWTAGLVFCLCFWKSDWVILLLDLLSNGQNRNSHDLLHLLRSPDFGFAEMAWPELLRSWLEVILGLSI